MKNIEPKDSEPPSMTDIAPEDDDPGGSSPDALLLNGDSNKTSSLNKMRTWLARLLSLKLSSSSSIEEEVADLIDEHDPDGSQVGSDERNIVSNVLGLSESTVSDVMVPRTDIVALDVGSTLDEVKKTIIEKEHTRTPIFNESLDRVVGFIHIKDVIPLFGSKNKFDINDILREILYVPPSMKILDLLRKMRAKRVHMALVLDEYGGTDGLVTMEDLMEEIVGEIEDEHDGEEEVGIEKVAKGVYEVNARSSVSDLEEKLKTRFKSDADNEDFETVGGLVFFMLGHVPEQGEVIVHSSGVSFEVLEADPRRVKKLLVKTKGHK